MDIFDNAKEKIIIIDNYAGKELLKSLKDIKKNIIIISSNVDNTLKEKYERQYTNVKFIANNTYHDRFILIDKNGIFLCFVELCLEHNNIDYKRELFVEDDHDKEYNLTASYHI